MNNRETIRGSPDAGDPGGENQKRQRQREADQFHRRIAAAGGRKRMGSCRDGGGIGFTHYAITVRWKKQRPRITEAFDAGRCDWLISGRC